MAKISIIKRKKILNERLYNLAVQDDESYIADGIVVHNCKSYLEPIRKSDKPVKFSPNGLQPSTSKIADTINLAEID